MIGRRRRRAVDFQGLAAAAATIAEPRKRKVVPTEESGFDVKTVSPAISAPGCCSLTHQ